MRVELPAAVDPPAGPSGDADWQDLTRDLRQVLRIHRAMMRKLLSHDGVPPRELSVALESFANRYLDFADEISDRWLRRSKVEEFPEAGVRGPFVAG